MNRSVSDEWLLTWSRKGVGGKHPSNPIIELSHFVTATLNDKYPSAAYLYVAHQER